MRHLGLMVWSEGQRKPPPLLRVNGGAQSPD
jgi:hypothetical protein